MHFKQKKFMRTFFFDCQDFVARLLLNLFLGWFCLFVFKEELGGKYHNFCKLSSKILVRCFLVGFNFHCDKFCYLSTVSCFH